mgnify:CR=1 FL=1
MCACLCYLSETATDLKRGECNGMREGLEPFMGSSHAIPLLGIISCLGESWLEESLSSRKLPLPGIQIRGKLA